MKNLLSIITLAFVAVFGMSVQAQTTYSKITSASGLEVGAKYVLVGFDDDGNAYAMSYQKSNNRNAIAVTENGGSVTLVPGTDPNSQTDVFEMTLGGNAGAWTLYDEAKGGYLNAPGGGNYLKTQTELTDNGKWDITFEADGGGIPVSNGGVDQCYMRFNLNASNGSPLFGCYKESSNIIARVYFYKAGGQSEPDPEPSNYPTNFTASVNMVDVTLSWTDATGEQLPARYLVLASKGSITVPVDGTPVANSALAVNVGYGVQTCTFTNLDANSTYHFAIFPYTNAGDNIDYKTSGSYPTADATTADVHILLNEGFEADLGDFVAYDVYGDQTWRQASYQGNGYANMNGYANGVDNANEDWLISPALDGMYAIINMSFTSATKFEGDALRLMVSSDYDGVSEPSDYSWDELTDMFDWSTDNYEWVESGVMNISNFVGETFYIAFVYTSSTTAAAAWEVDNILLIGEQPLAVADEAVATLSVMPNPAADMVRFELSNDAQVSVYDLSGRMVAAESMRAGQASMNVATLENGVYFLSVRYADGTKEIARFVKF